MKTALFKKDEIINFYGWKARIGQVIEPKDTNFNDYLYFVAPFEKVERSGLAHTAVGWENLIPYLNFTKEDVEAGLVSKYKNENLPVLCRNTVSASRINICDDSENYHKTKMCFNQK